jgi:general nucleoside transport system permease protein
MTSLAVATERIRNPLRALAWAGIGLGLLGAFIALPPVTARSWIPSLLLGLLAALAGVWAITRGEKRFGWYAVATAALGFGLAYLATRSEIGKLETVVVWSALFASMLRFATPLIFGALGGMFSERSGVVNVGLEGMMLMGAFWGLYGSDKGGTWVVGLLLGMASGGLLALVYAYFAIHLRADQIVGGTGINFLAIGITGYFFVQFYNGQVTGDVSLPPEVHIGGLGHFLEASIGNLSILTWASFVLVIVAYVVLFRTPIGLRIRACGEHPRAADTVGINVYLVRYGCVVLSGLLAAIGGVYLSLGPEGNGTFIPVITSGKGFIALAAVIFGNWRPAGAFGAALLFGFSTALALRLQVYSSQAATLFNILPYVLVLIAVAGVIGRTVAPAADGKPYAKQ